MQAEVFFLEAQLSLGSNVVQARNEDAVDARVGNGRTENGFLESRGKKRVVTVRPAEGPEASRGA